MLVAGEGEQVVVERGVRLGVARGVDQTFAIAANSTVSVLGTPGWINSDFTNSGATFTNFTVPAGTETGASSLVVVANGIPSAAVAVTISFSVSPVLAVTPGTNFSSSGNVGFRVAAEG